MPPIDRHLAQQLAAAIAIKVALLFVLWAAFVRPVHVHVDIERLIGSRPPSTHSQGETP